MQYAYPDDADSQIGRLAFSRLSGEGKGASLATGSRDPVPHRREQSAPHERRRGSDFDVTYQLDGAPHSERGQEVLVLRRQGQQWQAIWRTQLPLPADNP
jgi:hypothetical protein